MEAGSAGIQRVGPKVPGMMCFLSIYSQTELSPSCLSPATDVPITGTVLFLSFVSTLILSNLIVNWQGLLRIHICSLAY